MRYVIILLLFAVCFSCNDIESIQQDQFEIAEKNKMNESDPNARILTTPIPTYPLSWHTISYMPHPSLVIRAPWQAGVSARISNDILHDYNPADGWELVYNTFSSSTASSTLFFALYNKYRGLLRVYYYSKDDVSSIFTDYLRARLELEGSMISSSPVLNFASASAVDIASNNMSGVVMIPFQAMSNTWFAFEFELAYDSNISSRTFSQLAARLDIHAISITQVNLDGTMSGSLTGNVASSSTSLGINPNFSGNTTNYNNSTIINGEADSNKLNIGTIIKNGIKSGLTSGLAGLASNFLSGIFSMTSGSENVTKMSLDLNQNLTGSFTSGVGITAVSIPFTGTLSPIGSGAYSSPQGVFNLVGKPTIRVTKIHQRRLNSSGAEIEPLISYQYEIVSGTVNEVFNPAIIPSLGSISNKKYEVVVEDHASVTYNGTKEVSGSLNITTGTFVKAGPEPLTPIGVRISFKLTPSNGSNFVFHAKTFTANIIEQNVFLPPVGGGEDS